MRAAQRALVIGTGPGGLAAAAHLARDGFDVLALDQAGQFGGSLTPLERDGYTFDPGLRAVGECRPGQPIYAFFDELGLAADELFVEMNPNGHQDFRFPGFDLRMNAGRERLRRRLGGRFPAEGDALEHFFELVGRVQALRAVNEERHWQSIATHVLQDTLRQLELLRWRRATLKTLLETLFDDGRLRAVLGALSAAWGLPPSQASALDALRLIGHFQDGAFYPRGGAGRLRDVLVEYARTAGVQFLARQTITDILVEDGRAVGVRNDLGDEFDADLVVATLDPTRVYSSLIAAEHLPRRLRQKVRMTEPSLAPLQLFLGMEHDLRRHGLGQFDIVDLPSFDLEEPFAPLARGEFGDEHLLMVSSSTSKSPGARLAPDGGATLEIATYAPWEIFERRWREDGPSKHGYHEFRNLLADQLLAEFEARMPGLVDNVVTSEVVTPLTRQRWHGAIHGGPHGPAQSPARSMLFRFQTTTPVSNVFLAGSGTLGAGLGSALRSGRLAAKIALHRAEQRPRMVPTGGPHSEPRLPGNP